MEYCNRDEAVAISNPLVLKYVNVSELERRIYTKLHWLTLPIFIATNTLAFILRHKEPTTGLLGSFIILYNKQIRGGRFSSVEDKCLFGVWRVGYSLLGCEQDRHKETLHQKLIKILAYKKGNILKRDIENIIAKLGNKLVISYDEYLSAITPLVDLGLLKSLDHEYSMCMLELPLIDIIKFDIGKYQNGSQYYAELSITATPRSSPLESRWSDPPAHRKKEGFQRVWSDSSSDGERTPSPSYKDEAGDVAIPAISWDLHQDSEYFSHFPPSSPFAPVVGAATPPPCLITSEEEEE